MSVGFPPQPAFPVALDSDRTLFLVYNTSESRTTRDNAPWEEVVEIEPVGSDEPEVWADNGFANISGELFYYDSVEKDANGKVFRLKRCSRGLGGVQTRFNRSGTWVRGFVIAEHHNQLVDAIISTQGYILGLDESLRKLEEEPACVDDAPCVDVQIDTEVIEDRSTSPNCSGTTIRYSVVIEGNFNSFVIDFGDGQSTSSSLEGTHTYSPGSDIDPVVTVVSDACTVVQTPTDRQISRVPREPTRTTIRLFIPEVPDFPNIEIPDLVAPPPQIELPPIVFPCLDVIPNVNIPSIISITPPEISIVPPIVIPVSSVINFGPAPLVSTSFTFGPAPTIPSASFTFGPAPTIPSASFTFGPAPTIPPTSFTFGPAPTIPPTSFTFGPAPTIPPTSFTFGPAPTIRPVSFSFGPAPTIRPVSFSFGPAPTISNASFSFGPAPTIRPVSFSFGPAPTISNASFSFGPAPTIRPVSFSFGPAPTISNASFSFGPAPTISNASFTFGHAPTISDASFTFGPAPTIRPVSFSFGPAPTISNVSFTFGHAPTISDTSFTFGPAPILNSSFSWGTPPRATGSFSWGTPPRATGSFSWGNAPSITASMNWGTPPSVSASVYWGEVPNIVASVEWSSSTPLPVSIEWGSIPAISASVQWGDPPQIQVNWGSPPTISCVVAVECPSGGSTSTGIRRGLTLDDNFVDDFNTDDFEIEIGDLGIPSEIRIVAPKMPDIQVTHDIPSFIDIKSDIPSRITIYQADLMPREISVVAESLPRSIAVDASSVPSSIAIDSSSIPGFITLVAPDLPSVIAVDGSSIPNTIRVSGIPDSIEVRMPSEIVARLEVPENLEVPLVYRGDPVPIKFDASVISDGGEQMCFALVPCGKK